MARGSLLDRFRTLKQEKGTTRPAAVTRLSVNIGIDFGTTYTKVCYRNLGLEKSEVIAFRKPMQDDVSPAMIPSEILIGINGEIIAGVPRDPEQGPEYTKVDAIKIRLANLDPEVGLESFQFAPLKHYGDAKGIEVLAAIFLANVLISSRNWLRKNRSEMFVGRDVKWSASVGVPVRVFDSPAIKRFNKVLENAWHLAGEREDPISNIEMAGAILDQVNAQGYKSPGDAHAYPEIAAAILAFVVSPSAKDDHYLYLDVGGGTLDSVSFSLQRPEGQKRVDCYTAELQPLGVEAILSRNTELDIEAMRIVMIEGSTEPKFSSALSKEEKDIHSQVAKLVMGTKKKVRGWTQAEVNPDWYQSYKAGRRQKERGTLPVFIGGGGGRFKFYNTSILGTHETRVLNNFGIPQFDFFKVPYPSDLDLGSIPDEDFDRFSIAYGLSVDVGEAPDVTLPSDNPEAPKPKPRGVTPIGHYED